MIPVSRFTSIATRSASAPPLRLTTSCWLMLFAAVMSQDLSICLYPCASPRSKKKMCICSQLRYSLCLDAVGSLEHLVNVLEVVGTGGDGGSITFGCVALLEVSLFAKVAHLVHMLAAHPISYPGEVSYLTES